MDRNKIKIYLTFSLILFASFTEIFAQENEVEEKKAEVIPIVSPILNKTSAASSISGETIAVERKTSVDQVLTGNVPGLWAVDRSGMPGEGAALFWRGKNSIKSETAPLIIVDGVPFEYASLGHSLVEGAYINPLNAIDPNDVENVVFIRDAVAIYGARASNGVLLIETTRTDQTQTTISFSAYGGVTTSPEKQSVMDAGQFRSLASDLLASSSEPSLDLEKRYPFLLEDENSAAFHIYNHDTDWQDEIMQNGLLQGYNVKVDGGDEIAKYAFSAGYTNREGIVKNTDMTRYNVRLNANINIFKQFSFSPRVAVSISEFNLLEESGTSRANALYASYFKSPILGVYAKNEEGIRLPYYDKVSEFNVSHPLALVDNMKAETTTYRLNTSSKFTYDFGSGLKANYLISFDISKMRDKVFVPEKSVVNTNGNESRHGVERFLSFYNDLYLEKQFRLSNDHQLSALAGVRYRENKLETDKGYNAGSPSDDFPAIGSGGLDINKRSYGQITSWNEATAYGLVNYAFKQRYYLSGSLSYDGSSNYGEDADKYALFYSVGGRWKLSSENFLSSNSTINILSLRTNYSLTGNDRFSMLYGTRHLVAERYKNGSGVVNRNIANTKLSPEKTTTFDAGADASLFKDRLHLSATYYIRNTKDVLVQYDINELLTGHYVDNGAEIQNKGWELALDAKLLDRDVKFSVGGNIAMNDNQLKSVSNTSKAAALAHNGRIITDLLGSAQMISQEGAAMNQFFGYRALGVFKNAADAEKSNLKDADGNPFRAGDIQFEDVDKNGIIDEKDKQAIGNSLPDVTGGFFTEVKYKRFGLRLYGDFATGYDVYNFTRRSLESMSSFNNQSKATLRRWRKEGDVTDIPIASLGDPMGNSRFSTRWLESGDYIRLKTVSLTYEVPKLKFYRNLRVYLTMDNVMTRKDNFGYQPSESGYGLGRGIAKMPSSRSFVFGIQLGL